MSKDITLDLVAPRSAWLAFLGAASRVAKQGKPIPVLGSACVEATAAGVVWWATDTELWRGGALAVDSSTGDGAGLVPVARVLAMLKQCPEGPVRLAFTAEHVKVSAGDFAAKVPTLPVDDFPIRPNLPTGGGVALGRETLARVIRQVLPVSNFTGSKYFMRGALFQVGADGLLCVATDGHRLAKATAPRTNGHTTDIDTILPSQALGELGSMLGASDAADVIYSSAAGRHLFQVGSDVLIARPIEDKFPNYERIIPSKHTTRVVCNRKALADIVARVALAADDGSKAVNVDVSADGVTVSARSAKNGEASERLAPSSFDGPPVVFSLKGSYLADVLSIASAESITCDIKDALNAIVFTSLEDGAVTPYLHMIMTMRL